MANKLTYNSVMPFGQHKGMRMEHVPAEYLHDLWVNGVKRQSTTLIHKYIKENMYNLKMHYPDGIWT